MPGEGLQTTCIHVANPHRLLHSSPTIHTAHPPNFMASSILYPDTPSSRKHLNERFTAPTKSRFPCMSHLTDIAALPFHPSQSQANGRCRKSNVNINSSHPPIYAVESRIPPTILHSAVRQVARNRLTAHSSSRSQVTLACRGATTPLILRQTAHSIYCHRATPVNF